MRWESGQSIRFALSLPILSGTARTRHEPRPAMNGGGSDRAGATRLTYPCAEFPISPPTMGHGEVSDGPSEPVKRATNVDSPLAVDIYTT